MEPVLFIIPGACSFGSMVALEWAKVPYKIGITTPEIRASEEFRKVNPIGKVGALKDGENVIGENLAILSYIADKYSHADMSLNDGAYEKARVNQWLSYLSSTLHIAFAQALFPDRFINAKHAAEFKKEALERLEKILEYIDKSLANTGFFVGSKPTIIDAQAYGLLRWCNGFKSQAQLIDLNRYANIKKFMTAMEQEQAVQNSLAIENGQSDKVANSCFSGYFTFS